LGNLGESEVETSIYQNLADEPIGLPRFCTTKTHDN